MIKINKIRPNFYFEQQFKNQLVAGIDEVGIGSFAGPLVVVALILNQQIDPININDSKLLTKEQRLKLFNHISNNSIYATGIVSSRLIDQLKLAKALELAINRAYNGLLVKPDIALIDGNINYLLPCKTISIIKGDSLSLSIAAASIIAKVIRDQIMQKLAAKYPIYNWQNNVGYGTKRHLLALSEAGISAHHRLSFKAISKLLSKQQE